MPQTQQPSTHVAPPPTRSPRRCFSSGCFRPALPPPSYTWEILRGSFCSSSTYSHRLPSETRLPTPSVPPLHHGRNMPLLQGRPVHHRPVRRGYRRTGFIPPIQGRFQPQKVTSLDRTNDPVVFAKHFRTGFSGRPSWTLPADQPGLGDQPSMPVKTNEPPFGSPSSYDFSLTTSSPKGPRTKRRRCRTNHRHEPGPQTRSSQPVTDPNPEPKTTPLPVASDRRPRHPRPRPLRLCQ